MSAGASTVEGIVTNSREAYLAHPEGVESEAVNWKKVLVGLLLVSGGRRVRLGVAELLRNETAAELNQGVALGGEAAWPEATRFQRVEAFSAYQRLGSHNECTTRIYQRRIMNCAPHG
jgi:hypothetical protein